MISNGKMKHRAIHTESTSGVDRLARSGLLVESEAAVDWDVQKSRIRSEAEGTQRNSGIYPAEDRDCDHRCHLKCNTSLPSTQRQVSFDGQTRLGRQARHASAFCTYFVPLQMSPRPMVSWSSPLRLAFPDCGGQASQLLVKDRTL